MSTVLKIVLSAVCASTAWTLAYPVSAGDWPRFRGPNGTGVSDEKGIPTQWAGSDAVLWKIALPGLGHSSPVVFGEEVYVTVGRDGGKTRELLCLNAKDGSTRWTRKLPAEGHPIHKKSSFASGSPAVDAQRVYVPFTTAAESAVYAFDKTGSEAWHRPLGEFVSKHGSGTSPIRYGDFLFLGNDQGGKGDSADDVKEGKSSVVALDAKTGEVRWKVDRPTELVGYSSPIIIEAPDQDPELIVTGRSEGIAAYDPLTGKKKWWVPLFTMRAVGSAVYADGLVIASCGQGSGGKQMIAVRPGGTGDVSKTHVAWQAQKLLPYVPTPLAFGKYLFVVSDGGVASCLEAKTGNVLWTRRLGGTYAASLLCIDGKIYAVSEAGEVHVFEAGPKENYIGKSSVGEPVYATPAVAGGKLFIRTHQSLICIGKK